MPTQNIRGGRPLLAVFAALLAGCTERELPGDSDSGGTSSGDATSTSTGTTTTTGDPTTTTTPGTLSTTGEPNTGSATGTDSGSQTTDPTYEPPECVYETHMLELTPEQYQAWLDGEGQVGTTSGGSTAGGEEAGSTTTSGGVDETTTGGTTGEWTMALCVEICVALTGASEWDIESCSKLEDTPEGNISIRCKQIVEHCDGRSHACIRSRGAVVDDDPVGAWFARAAHDEAASVYAFAALAGELASLGAPAELLARLRSAAADELRHARAVSRLAASRGARCRPPVRQDVPPRSAREIAVENAVEGCVRETWAALLAAHQAEHAADPQVRDVMRAIAADEARHAELAWAIDAWLHGLLDPDARAEVAAARARAAAEVVAGVAAGTPPAVLVREAGVPGPARATRLVAGLAAVLWAS